MFLRKLFPYALAACSLVGMTSVPAQGQSSNTHHRQVQAVAEHNEVSCSPDDFAIISVASTEDIRAAYPAPPPPVAGDRFRQLITAAIDERLGSRYRWGGTGPNGFDCSGFVWSIFQSAGITFERGSARALWGRFEPPAAEDKYKFGTLVFFSNLAHVGVVADQDGFYHASRRHGVIYSQFNDYWLSRIDGFRKVPVPAMSVGE
jgi:cell wall-associated NlpC family hydrolase